MREFGGLRVGCGRDRRRAAWCALLGAWAMLGCDGGSNLGAMLPARAGLRHYERYAAIPVPGGTVNAAGGNLLVRRVDLSIDTRLGERKIGATYNSKLGVWLWSFDITYDGSLFIDPTGAYYRIQDVPAGDLIPGSVWVKVDDSAIKSVGGLVHRFDATHRLEAIHWSSADYPRLVYRQEMIAGSLRATAIEQCTAPGECAGIFAIARDAVGRVASITDRAGRRAEFGYDLTGLLVTARDGFDVVRDAPGFYYEYLDGGRLRALTNSEGERIEYLLLASRRVSTVQQIGEGNPLHRFEYAHSLPKSGGAYRTVHTDPLGAQTTYRYDHSRRLHSVELPTGEQIRREWAGHFVTGEILPGGVTTLWEHIDFDEVVRTDPSGNEAVLNFRINGGENRENPFARPIDRIDDSLGPVERRGYDAQGRLAWIENGEGERVLVAYDADEMIASVTLPNGVTAAFAGYGEHGHATLVSFAGEVEDRVYDSVGNRIEVRGSNAHNLELGGELARAYDEDRNLGDLTLVGLAADGSATAPQVISLEHRSDGQLLRVERPGGGDDEFAYDALGRLLERRERVGGLWRVTRVERDRAGRVTAVELPNGMRRETSYDGSGRIAALAALRDGVEEGRAELGYSDGRLASLDDSKLGGVEHYAYDAAGRLIETTFAGGEVVETAFDLRSRKLSETHRLADGSVLRELGFAHDLAGRELSLLDGGEVVLQRAFEDGDLVQTDYGNGLERSYVYAVDSGRLTSALTVDSLTGQVVEASSVDLAVSPGDGMVSLTATTATLAGVTAITVEQYDLGPPGDSTASPGKRVFAWSGNAAAETYAYDALSNLVASAPGLAYAYNAESNRLLAIDDTATGLPVATYTYDEAGFVTERNGAPIAWSAQGFVAAIGDAWAFEWDMQGRPVRREQLGEETLYTFGGRVETAPDGSPRRLDLGEVELRLDSGTRRYRHLDFRGNVKFTSDDTGAIEEHIGYAAYGIDVAQGGSDGAATFAQGRDLGDLVVLGHRLHDPLAGRFLAPDPIYQLVNQYTYTLGNPVGYWDPSGSFSKPTGTQVYFTLVALVGGIAGGLLTHGHIAGVIAGVGVGLIVGEFLFQAFNPGERALSPEDVAKALTNFVDPTHQRRSSSQQTSTGQGDATSGNITELGGPNLNAPLPHQPEGSHGGPNCSACDAIPGSGGSWLQFGTRFAIHGIGGFGGIGGF